MGGTLRDFPPGCRQKIAGFGEMSREPRAGLRAEHAAA
jgi:hypothetical protein